MRLCSIEDCGSKHYMKGWCIRHYRRWEAHGDPLTILTDRGRPLIERFHNRYTVVDSGCWLWDTGRGVAKASGYASFAISHTRTVRAHRWSYEHFVGPIPDGWTVDHECHNRDTSCKGGPTCIHRRCVNPEHLVAKPLRDNLMGGQAPSAINARKTHCPKGHPYDGTGSKGERLCKRCRAEDQRRFQARKRAGLVGT